MVALALTVAALVCTSVLTRPPAGLVRTNFRGKEIPVVGGLVIVAGLLAGEVALALAYLLGHGAARRSPLPRGTTGGLLVAALGFFGVGLLGRPRRWGRAEGLFGATSGPSPSVS